MATTYQDWASQSLAGPIDLDADVIDLDALTTPHRRRTSVRIAGANYDVALPEDLSIIDNTNVQRAFKRIWEIEHTPGDADGQIDQHLIDTMERLERRLCEIGLYGEAGNEGVPMPAGERAELVARLLPVQRKRLRDVFFQGFDSLVPLMTEMVQSEVKKILPLIVAQLREAEKPTPTPAPTNESAPDSTATSETPKKRQRRSPSATKVA